MPRPTESVNLAVPVRTQEKARPCFRCGRCNDLKLCKFREAKCHRCGRLGHIAPVCKTASPPPVDRGAGKRSGYRSYHRRKVGGIKWVEVDEEDADALPLFLLQGDFPQPPIFVTMTLEGSPAQFELDTGAVVTVMPEEKFRQLFADQPLKQTSVELKTYAGELLEIVGETSVEVSYQDQEPKTLPLVVVRVEGPPLLGRNWLKHFNLTLVASRLSFRREMNSTSS